MTSKLDEIAWLLNIRGNDLEYTPVFLSYLFLEFSDSKTSGALFIDSNKLNSKVKKYLMKHNIKTYNYDKIF